MLLSNKEDPTTDVYNQIDLKNYGDQKNPDTKEYTLYDFIYMKFKNQQNESSVTETRK